MKHNIIKEESLGNHIWRITIELIPESEIEINAILRTSITEASDSERELIDNCLHSSLSRYSITNFVGQNQSFFVVDAFLN
jgi:hypothetical protein